MRTGGHAQIEWLEVRSVWASSLSGVECSAELAFCRASQPAELNAPIGLVLYHYLQACPPGPATVTRQRCGPACVPKVLRTNAMTFQPFSPAPRLLSLVADAALDTLLCWAQHSREYLPLQMLHYQWFADFGNVDAAREAARLLAHGSAADHEQAVKYLLQASRPLPFDLSCMSRELGMLCSRRRPGGIGQQAPAACKQPCCSGRAWLTGDGVWRLGRRELAAHGFMLLSAALPPRRLPTRGTAMPWPTLATCTPTGTAWRRTTPPPCPGSAAPQTWVSAAPVLPPPALARGRRACFSPGSARHWWWGEQGWRHACFFSLPTGRACPSCRFPSRRQPGGLPRHGLHVHGW